MFSKMRSKKGFTMVELLVVLVIIGILAAVAAPIYIANVKRAKAAEAVAVMSLVRQAERNYYASTGSYTADIPDITAALPTGLDIDVGVAQYFSNACYTVDVGGTSARFAGPGAVDFIVKVDGSDSVTATATGGAINYDEVAKFGLEMDNSGRIYVSYNLGEVGEKWSAW